MNIRASASGGFHHRGQEDHRGGTEENPHVIRDTGAMATNDEHWSFLRATSVILLSSVVKGTARTGTATELEKQL
jgi:hypothetical protein